MDLSTLTTKLIQNNDLSYNEMRSVMQGIMTGQVSDIQMAGFLSALAAKKESVEEILAGAEIMRELATVVPIHESHQNTLVDPVGTGGTHSKVFNVSTASAIAASCAGVKIAKHGGRAASSQSGSADFLEIAGININLTPEQIAQCVEQFGIGFMFAPHLHNAMRHVAPVRKALGIRTIFNVLGPLTNPSGAKKQVLGVFDKALMQPLLAVSQRLGKEKMWVVHSHDGLDEISIAAPTDVLTNEREFTINPKDYDIYHDNLDAVRVNSAQESYDLICDAFSGRQTPAYDMIVLNAAAILVVADVTDDYSTAVSNIQTILDSGEATKKLTDYATFSQNICIA